MAEFAIGHLNGCTVAILADGEVLPQQVVTAGVITLDKAYAKVSVGLPYYSDLETLNIEVGLKDGSLQGRRIKLGNVMFRVENTRGGWVGPNEDVLYEAFPEAINEKLLALDHPTDAMFTGDIRIPLGAGYEDGGRVFYRQVDPLPVTINAVVPEVAAGGPSAA